MKRFSETVRRNGLMAGGGAQDRHASDCCNRGQHHLASCLWKKFVGKREDASRMREVVRRGREQVCRKQREYQRLVLGLVQ